MGNKHKWSYPEGIFRNNYGQLTCDGFCPDEIESMKDKNGRIIKDSLTSFHKLIDTAHIPHSISSTAWCYEWDGIDFIDAIKNVDTIFLATALNEATHCSLQLSIAGVYCYPLINLISIVKGGSGIYYCTDGSITIDKTLFQKGIVKEIFSFNFKHEENPKEPMFWKGKIYAPIKIQP